MDTYQAIVTKRDVREFSADPVDEGHLRRILQAARMATANSLGLASCPMTFHDEDCAREVLGLPNDLTAPMGIAVGQPGPPDPDREASPRIPLDDLVRWGHWSD